MHYVAGMDGGGTKTMLEARAGDGRVLLRAAFSCILPKESLNKSPGASCQQILRLFSRQNLEILQNS